MKLLFYSLRSWRTWRETFLVSVFILLASCQTMKKPEYGINYLPEIKADQIFLFVDAEKKEPGIKDLIDLKSAKQLDSFLDSTNKIFGVLDLKTQNYIFLFNGNYPDFFIERSIEKNKSWEKDGAGLWKNKESGLLLFSPYKNNYFISNKDNFKFSIQANNQFDYINEFEGSSFGIFSKTLPIDLGESAPTVAEKIERLWIVFYAKNSYEYNVKIIVDSLDESQARNLSAFVKMFLGKWFSENGFPLNNGKLKTEIMSRRLIITNLSISTEMLKKTVGNNFLSQALLW